MSLNLLLLLLSLILFQQSICDGEGEGDTPATPGGTPAETPGETLAGTTGEDTIITNNCGMAKWYQPNSKETCIEISLVDGYCCYVETQSHGKACIRQGEIDEDNKNEITDEMRNAVKRLNTGSGEPVIKSVQCKGYYIAFYGLSLLLLAIML